MMGNDGITSARIKSLTYRGCAARNVWKRTVAVASIYRADARSSQETTTGGEKVLHVTYTVIRLYVSMCADGCTDAA